MSTLLAILLHNTGLTVSLALVLALLAVSALLAAMAGPRALLSRASSSSRSSD